VVNFDAISYVAAVSASCFVKLVEFHRAPNFFQQLSWSLPRVNFSPTSTPTVTHTRLAMQLKPLITAREAV